MKRILFFKSHIEGYTRKDGTYVKPHEDSRTKHATGESNSEHKEWTGGSDDVAEIERLIEDDPYADYGLRVIPSGYEVSAGSSLPNSRVWDDGYETDEELPGVSTIGVNPGSVERAIKFLKKNGYYGSQIALVKGESKGAGQDEGERVIADPEVVAVWSRSMTKAILFVGEKL